MLRRNVYLSSAQYKALRTLSHALGIRGQRDRAGELPEGISPLTQELGEIASGALNELVAAIEIARRCANGGDWDESIEDVRPTHTAKRFTEAYEAEMEVKSVFFGIMVGDLFADDDELVDVDASVRQYAEQIEAVLKARYGDIAVEWGSQNAGGVIPHGLRTRVNGETDHPEVESVDILIGEVWQRWEWAVYETA